VSGKFQSAHTFLLTTTSDNLPRFFDQWVDTEEATPEESPLVALNAMTSASQVKFFKNAQFISPAEYTRDQESLAQLKVWFRARLEQFMRSLFPRDYRQMGGGWISILTFLLTVS
jgi:hypothetical protein